MFLMLNAGLSRCEGARTGNSNTLKKRADLTPLDLKPDLTAADFAKSVAPPDRLTTKVDFEGPAIGAGTETFYDVEVAVRLVAVAVPVSTPSFSTAKADACQRVRASRRRDDDVSDRGLSEGSSCLMR